MRRHAGGRCDACDMLEMVGTDSKRVGEGGDRGAHGERGLFFLGNGWA